MRHAKHQHTLGVSGSHRQALLANLASALIRHGRIKTTLSKAKALRPFIEKIITMAKKAHVQGGADALHLKRLAIARLHDEGAVDILFKEKAEQFVGRNGGYTRIYKLIKRVGDGADVAIIELLAADDAGYTKRSSRKSGNAANAPVADSLIEDAEVAVAEIAEEPVAQAPEGDSPDSDKKDA